MYLRRLMNLKLNYLTLAPLLAALSLLAGSASAQSYLSPGYIIGEIRDGLGFVQPESAPDFVVRGRPDPASLEYVPLKDPPRGFHSEAMTPAGRLQAEAGTIAELESARASTQARAAGVAPPKAGSCGAAPIPSIPTAATATAAAAAGGTAVGDAASRARSVFIAGRATDRSRRGRSHREGLPGATARPRGRHVWDSVWHP